MKERMCDMERMTIQDVKIDEKTTRRTIIDGDVIRACGMEFYWRLKKIEDILGEDYDLDRLRELVEADQEKRCVIYRKGYGVVSEYEVDEEGFITRTATGVVTREEYDRVLKGDANG